MLADYPSAGDDMAENGADEGADLKDVFDVSSAPPSDAEDAELTAQVDEQWQTEAGIIGSPPAPDAAYPSADAEGSETRWEALSVGQPSKPLFGRLPLARVVPQDVHSVMDYVDASGVLAGAFLTSCPKARAASWAMGASGIAVSAVTDYKLSLAKVLP